MHGLELVVWVGYMYLYLRTMVRWLLLAALISYHGTHGNSMSPASLHKAFSLPSWFTFQILSGRLNLRRPLKLSLLLQGFGCGFWGFDKGMLRSHGSNARMSYMYNLPNALAG